MIAFSLCVSLVLVLFVAHDRISFTLAFCSPTAFNASYAVGQRPMWWDSVSDKSESEYYSFDKASPAPQKMHAVLLSAAAKAAVRCQV